jgi:GntR family transcriptional regulator
LFQLDLKSRKSIYEQVVDNLKELIVHGVLKPDDKLPSVRDLSGQITVNPNTVQKAYAELERQGYVYMVSGLGTFVASGTGREIDKAVLSDIEYRMAECVSELRYQGMSGEDIRGMFEKIMKERGDGKC